MPSTSMATHSPLLVKMGVCCITRFPCSLPPDFDDYSPSRLAGKTAAAPGLVSAWRRVLSYRRAALLAARPRSVSRRIARRPACQRLANRVSAVGPGRPAQRFLTPAHLGPPPAKPADTGKGAGVRNDITSPKMVGPPRRIGGKAPRYSPNISSKPGLIFPQIGSCTDPPVSVV